MITTSRPRGLETHTSLSCMMRHHFQFLRSVPVLLLSGFTSYTLLLTFDCKIRFCPVVPKHQVAKSCREGRAQQNFIKHPHVVLKFEHNFRVSRAENTPLDDVNISEHAQSKSSTPSTGICPHLQASVNAHNISPHTWIRQSIHTMSFIGVHSF